MGDDGRNARAGRGRLVTAPTAPPVTEAQAEAAVVDYFRLFGWEVRRVREDFHNKDGCLLYTSDAADE